MLQKNEPNPAGVGMLMAFGRLGKPVYGGTAPEHVVARRRAANKVARRSRRTNRRSK